MPLRIPELRRAVGQSITTFVIAVVALSGCGTPEEKSSPPALLDCGASAGPIVEVGTGAYAFEPIEDGANVPIVHGPQGGHHVWISVRARGFGPRVRVAYEVQNASDGTLLTPPGLSRIVTLADGELYGEFSGLLGFLVTSNPAELASRPVIVQASVADACHAPLSASVHAILVSPGG